MEMTADFIATLGTLLISWTVVTLEGGLSHRPQLHSLSDPSACDVCPFPWQLGAAKGLL